MKEYVKYIKELILLIVIAVMAFYIYIDEKKISDLVDDQVELELRLDRIEKVFYAEAEDPIDTGIPYDVSELKEIKGSDIIQESNEKIVVMIGRETCGYCAAYAPIISKVTKEYNIKARYIDLEKIEDVMTGEIIDQKSYDTIYNLDTTNNTINFMSQNFGSTPLTIIVENGTLTNALVGYVPEETLKEFLENSGFSK